MDLIVWQKAHKLTLAVYQHTASMPKSELYGLTSQMRRAAVSVAANIAEGFKRWGRQDKARFLNIAACWLEEVRYYLILARDLEYLDAKNLMPLLEDVSRGLEAYTRKLLGTGF